MRQAITPIRFALLVCSLAIPGLASSQTCPVVPPTLELPPGRIRNPDGGGLQLFQSIAYNSVQDYYLAIYRAGSPRVIGITPSGSVTPEIVVGPNTFVQSVNLVYNPDKNEFLALWRNDTPTDVYGRYLDGNGQPLGNPFLIGSGADVRGAYSTSSKRYLVLYSGIGIGTRYRVVAGDSSAPSPLLSGPVVVDSTGFSARIAYGSGANQFLIVFVKDLAPPNRAEVWGRFVSGDGGSVGGVIGIGVGFDNQQVPEIAYSEAADNYLVSFEDWAAGNPPDVRFHLVSSAGVVGSRKNLTGTPGLWDTPGAIAFNSATGKYVGTWFEGVTGYYREVEPFTGALGPGCVYSYLNAAPLGVAARPDPGEPQAAVVFRNFLGADGVHVSIIELPAPPPSFSSNTMPDGYFQSSYSQMVPVVGGDHPLSFQLLAGTLPPGLSGPDPTTGIVSGTPTSLGTFGPFRVRVTDSQSRSAEADLTMTVKLAPPTPQSPASDIANLRPTFTWTAVAGATSYNISVENLTDGGTISITGITGTSAAPATDLPANKDFRWRVQAVQGANLSPFSSYLNFRTDLTPGSAIVLTGSVPNQFPPIAGVTAIASSGEASSAADRAKAVDGNASTFWSTPARSVLQTEFITLDMGTTRTIDHLRMLSRDTAPQVFPKDFEIQLSPDNVNYATAATVTNFSAAASTWYDFPLAASAARYVRIWVTKPGQYTNGLYYVQIAEIELSQGVASAGSIQLSWLSPGDDGVSGTASSYDLRYQVGTSINYGSAVQAVGEPTPAPAGTLQSFTLTALVPETFYAVAIKSTDDAGNISPISNTVVVATTGIAPEPVTTLATTTAGLTTMGVQWTAPHEDGPAGGAVTSYDLRYSTSPITPANFDAATQVSAEPAPLAPGTLQSKTVTGLTSNTKYYFAIKSIDDVGNVSLISNVASASTLDDVPPAAITDLSGTPGGASYTKLMGVSAISSSGELSVHVKERAVDGDTSLIWSTPGRTVMQNEQITLDLGSSQPVGRLRMRSRIDLGTLFPVDFTIQVSTNNVSFTDALTVTGYTSGPGAWNTFTFPAVTGRFVRVLVTKSGVFSGNGLYYVQIAEIEVHRLDAVAGGVTLQWTSPGDDGSVGTATAYDFRYSPNPILTDADFLAAVQVDPAIVPAPQPAGSIQTLTVTGLGTENVLWWAVKTADERPNVSALSNSVKVASPGTAPAAVTNLQVTGRTSTSINLSWTATGDDGTTGTAQAYELRYSTAPISSLVSFEAATQAPTPSPKPPGGTELVTVNGLANETTYYFALRVIDDADLTSALSNVVSESTLDSEAPAAISDLTAAFPVMGLVKRSAKAVASSGDLSVHVKERAVDGNVTTIWSSPARDVQQVEFLTVDLQASFTIGRVRLRSRSDLGEVFPRDFSIQVSDDGTNFTTAHTENDFVADPGTWYTFDFIPKSGRFVRIQITEMNAYSGNGKFYAQIAELEVYEGGLVFDRANLTWTAPGDNGSQGTASAYDIRYKTTPINNNSDFNSAVQLIGEPAPGAPGTLQGFTVMGLPAEATLYFAIKTLDEVPNTSALSNIPVLSTPAVPPGAVTDLAVGPVTATSVGLTWTATGDDGNIGIASAYDIRYRTMPILSEADFAVATQAVGEPTPGSPGTSETFVVTGLSPDITYYFALKVLDEAGGKSPLSNVLAQATADAEAPAKVTDLTATPGGYSYTLSPASAVASSGELSGSFVRGNAVDGNVTSFWSSPARSVAQQEFLVLDLGSNKSVGRLRMRSRDGDGAYLPKDFEIQMSTNGSSFTTIHSVTGLSSTAGSWYTFDFTPGSGRYLRLLVTGAHAHPTTGLFYVQIAEVEAYVATDLSDRVTLSWTAPGDNGASGIAAAYDVRYSTSSIDTIAQFNSATPVGGEPSPQPAGAMESFIATGLPGETVLYFALRTSDGTNASPVSNSPSVNMPPIPPAAVTDLAVSGFDATSVDLSWTATGDDGATGTATTYDIRYSTAPILSLSDFGSATPASGEPAPQASGTPESFSVTGLTSDTTYYFAMQVTDDFGGSSGISNLVSQTTADGVAPAPVTGLAGVGGGVTYLVRGVLATQASGEIAPSLVKQAAVDRNNDTMWSTPGRTVMQEEFLVVDVGAVLTLGRIRLRSRNNDGTYFPKDFVIEVSGDGNTYTPVRSVNDFTASAAAWYSFDFTPTPGRFVRLRVTETVPHPTTGLFYVQVAEMEVSQATILADRVTLTWTATGDNGTVGTASSYDVRYRTSPIVNDSDFAAANQAVGEPTPQAAGAPETFVVTGLAPNTSYYFAVKAIDDSGNSSALSSVGPVTTPVP